MFFNFFVSLIIWDILTKGNLLLLKVCNTGSDNTVFDGIF